MAGLKRRTGRDYSAEQLTILGSTFPVFRIPVERETSEKEVLMSLEKDIVWGHKPTETLGEVHRLRSETGEEQFHSFEDLTAEYGLRRARRVTPQRFLGAALKLKEPKEKPKISATKHYLNQIEQNTRGKIREFMGEFYDSKNFSSNIWNKIKETNIDLAWVTKSYGFDRDEFCRFLVPVRLLNEAVYWMDAIIENDGTDDREKILNAFRKRGQMYSDAVRYMNRVGKKELAGAVSQIMYAIDIHYMQESFNQTNQQNKNLGLELKHLGSVYEEILEPSDEEYLDTGSYGTMFSHWFNLRDKRNFQILWNNSRRATDVIDGLVDLKYDVRNGVFCPSTIYVYSQCPEKEKEIMLESFSTGKDSFKIEEIVKKHSHDLLERTKEYVSHITPQAKNVRMFKNRALEIIDYGIGMTKDLPLFSWQYNKFYDHSLD